MNIIDHNSQPQEDWRAGVTTRMRISAMTGAAQIAIFEQWCAPGVGAPTHWHLVEEVLTVVAGQADIWIDDEIASVTAGQSVMVPAGRRHGFRNSGQRVLHMLATLAGPIFEAHYDDGDRIVRRWVQKPE
jgi:mannose-6-phosphate isomerase-like protein (cupin superfamily)